jgi:tetratricopeptide (TPR) repeat protein
MSAALMFRKDERRLAGPTEAFTTRPSHVTIVDPLDGDDESPVMAIVEQAQALADRNPTSLAARARLAHALLAAGYAAKARREAIRIVDDPLAHSDPPAVVASAIVLASTGDSERAEAALTLLGGRWYPHLYAQFAIERHDWESALVRLDSADDHASRSLRGWLLIQMHRYADAVRCFRSLMSDGGATPDVYLNLGYAYGALGSLRKAIQSTSAAQQLAPASRTAGFNLAAFSSATGDLDAALAALAVVRDHHPDELPVRLATASLYSRFGDLDRAARELRSASTSRAKWAAAPAERAALAADRVVVQHALSQVSTDVAFKRVLSIVKSTNYSQVGVARLLVGWLTSTAQAQVAAELVSELSLRHPATVLGAFRTRAAFLHRDFDRSLEEAERWSRDEPFDVAAVMMLTYLLIEYANNPTEAIRVGQRALTRMPAEVVVRNNVAYALALRGEYERAWRQLTQGNALEDPVCLATAGFIRLRSGRVDEGLDLYRRAIELADRSNANESADLLRHRGALEALRAGRDLNVDLDDIERKHVDDPRFALSQRERYHVVSLTLPRTPHLSHAFIKTRPELGP